MEGCCGTREKRKGFSEYKVCFLLHFFFFKIKMVDDDMMNDNDSSQ